MRPGLVAIILSAGALQVSAVQERQVPVPLYRGPAYTERPAQAIEPTSGLPVELLSASYTSGGLQNPASITISIRSRTLRPIPVSGITLRAAYGPTPDGMVTFRLRPLLAPIEADAVTRIMPNGAERSLLFVIVDEDPRPGLVSMLLNVRLVYTVERIESEEGPPIFENPDATELLWNALGRPSFSQH